MFPNVKRIFFDSGNVLVYPRSGSWHYPTNYIEYCNEHKILQYSAKQSINSVFAFKYLNDQRLIPDIEFTVFTNFYKKLFKGIPEKDNDKVINMCATGKVLDSTKYLFYDDVKATIDKLTPHYKLGIISDAWPSLIGIYKRENLYTAFDPFIISTLFGYTKESNELFKIALSKVKEKPNECLFIDDHSGNCVKACRLGMEVLLLNRERNSNGDKIKSIKDLNELVHLLLN